MICCKIGYLSDTPLILRLLRFRVINTLSFVKLDLRGDPRGPFGCGRKSYWTGKFHHASNLSSRSIHLAGLSIAGFLRVFPQCAGAHHAVPQGGTSIILYHKQFPLHSICNWNPVDWNRRTLPDSTYRTAAISLVWTLWHESERATLISWQESSDHHWSFFSHGVDRFFDPCDCPG